jgi:hypothetical protein
MVLNGVALIMSCFVMAPVGMEAMRIARAGGGTAPGTSEVVVMMDAARQPFRRFLLAHTREREKAFFMHSARQIWPKDQADALKPDDLIVLAPAFTLTELTDAFRIGFLIYLAFIVVDLVIANALMARYVPVLFTSVIELTGLFEDELGEVLRRMRSAKLLVLDDLGAERSTDFKVEQVYNVVNSRCNDMKPMIVTTNCTLDEMRGEKDLRYRRIWERVRSMCRPVRMDGESWRKRKTVEAIRRMKEG